MNLVDVTSEDSLLLKIATYSDLISSFQAQHTSSSLSGDILKYFLIACASGSIAQEALRVIYHQKDHVLNTQTEQHRFGDLWGRATALAAFSANTNEDALIYLSGVVDLHHQIYGWYDDYLDDKLLKLLSESNAHLLRIRRAVHTLRESIASHANS